MLEAVLIWASYIGSKSFSPSLYCSSGTYQFPASVAYLYTGLPFNTTIHVSLSAEYQVYSCAESHTNMNRDNLTHDVLRNEGKKAQRASFFLIVCSELEFSCFITTSWICTTPFSVLCLYSIRAHKCD